MEWGRDFEEARQLLIQKINDDSQRLSQDESSEVEDEVQSDEEIIYSKNTPSDKRDKTTDDGFKIIDSIPEDDSDISDAFESDYSDEEDNKSSNGKSQKMTDDGFKIVNSIPDDDSDISDAFDSDCSDMEEDTKESTITQNEIKNKIITSKQSKGKKLDIVESNKTSRTIISNKVNKSSPNNNEKVTEKEDKEKVFKRKRGRKNKKLNVDSTNNSMTDGLISTNKKKKKQNANKFLPFTDEELEQFKSSRHPRSLKYYQSLIDHGNHSRWEEFENAKEREKRELARLPQPEKRSDCEVYLKKCKGTGKVLTVYDYSRKNVNRKAKIENDEKVVQNKPKTDEERQELKIQKKLENKESMRAMGKHLRDFAIETMDPDTKRRKMQEKLERLGAPKAKTPFVNYKILMEQRKLVKLNKAVENEHLKDIGMHEKVKKNHRKMQRKDPNDVGGFTNQSAGRFKDGVLVLNKRFLNMVKETSTAGATDSLKKNKLL